MDQLVEMHGGGPWGIRLYGGGNDALVVARLRKRSRGMDAGLMEGDTLNSINGQSCAGMSHGTAMSLLEGAGPSLRLAVKRGGNVAVPAAQPVQTSAPNANQFPSPSSSYHTASPGPYDRRDSYTLDDVDHRKHVVTETSQKKFGDTTVTKVTREIEFMPHQQGAPSPSRMFQPAPQGSYVPTAPSHQPQQTWAPAPPPSRDYAVRPQPLIPQFQVSNFTNNINQAPTKPGIWSPQAGAITVQAPTGVQVEHNPDQSVTMTLGFGGGGGGGGGGYEKENFPPQHPLSQPLVPKFTVKKVTNVQAPVQSWQPGGARPPAPYKPREPSPVAPPREPSPIQPGKWQPSFQPAPIQRPPPRPMTPPQQEPERMMTEMEFTFPDGGPDMRQRSFDVSKLMFTGYSSDEGSIESPSGFRRKKKKVPTATLR